MCSSNWEATYLLHVGELSLAAPLITNSFVAHSLSRRNMMHGKKFVAGGESEEADDDGRLGGGAPAPARGAPASKPAVSPEWAARHSHLVKLNMEPTIRSRI